MNIDPRVTILVLLFLSRFPYYLSQLLYLEREYSAVNYLPSSSVTKPKLWADLRVLVPVVGTCSTPYSYYRVPARVIAV